MKMMSAVVLAALVASVASSLITFKLVCRSCPPSVCETSAVKDPGPALPADQVAAMDARLNDCRKNITTLFEFALSSYNRGAVQEPPVWSSEWPAASKEDQLQMDMVKGRVEFTQGKRPGLENTVGDGREMSKAEADARLQQYQMKLIREGKTPLPIPLTEEMKAQLAKEGIEPPTIEKLDGAVGDAGIKAE